jgi:LEA14-like dessication related protein
MKKSVAKFWFFLVLLIPFWGCEGVDDALNLLNCKFEMQGVEQFSVAGVQFDQIDSLTSIDQISAEDRAIIEAAIAEKNAPLMFTVKILGTNPNDVNASVDKLQWKLELNEQEIAEGAITDKIAIPALSSNTLIFTVDANVTNIFEDNVLENVFDLYKDIVEGQSASITVKIKPTIGGNDFPDYIPVQYVVNGE